MMGKEYVLDGVKNKKTKYLEYIPMRGVNQ